MLLREVRAQGYTYGPRNVYRLLRQVEREAAAPRPAGVAPRSDIPSPRHVASLLVQRPERLTEEDAAYLTCLGEQAPTVAQAYALTTDFATLLRERQGQQLDAWVARAKASGIKELAVYARSLESDHAAVKAGLQEVWSNGRRRAR